MITTTRFCQTVGAYPCGRPNLNYRNPIMKSIAIIFLFTILSCSENDNELIKLKKQINTFEANKSYFQNFSITSLRDSDTPKPLEFIVRRNNFETYAIIQTKPELKILRNFTSNLLDEKFLSAFAAIDCRYLYVSNEYVKIENIKKRKRVILFKGKLPLHEKNLEEGSEAIEGVENWRIKR